MEQIAAEEQAERRRQKQIAALQAVGVTIKPEASPHVQEVDSTAAQEAPRQEVAIARPSRRSDRRTRPPVVRQRPPIVISVRALAVGCVVGLLVVLGLVAFNSQRPALPLSPDALMKDGYVKQDLPFGAAILTPPPTSQVTTKKSPAIRSASRKPSANTSKRSSQAGPDDVVVRHFPAAAPKPQPSTANLKRNSDTD